MPSRPRSVVLLSGGLDSATLATLYLSDGWDVSALFVDHGQDPRVEERRAAETVATTLGIGLECVSTSGPTQVAAGHALPGRNGLLLLTALSRYAQAVDVVGIGVHGGSAYWDCSPDFVRAMQVLFDGYTLGLVRVGAPFLTWSKREIGSYAKGSGAPFGSTYSCEFAEGPCGKCGSCRDVDTALA